MTRAGAHAARSLSHLPARAIVLIFRGYQLGISRYTPPSCRYYPTCSEYGVRAVRTHGAIKGLILTAWRILRCNPFSRGGVDHVPPKGRWRNPKPAQPDSYHLARGETPQT